MVGYFCPCRTATAAFGAVGQIRPGLETHERQRLQRGAFKKRTPAVGLNGGSGQGLRRVRG
jgi:hypothetical protein